MENTNQTMAKTGDENPVNRISTKLTLGQQIVSTFTADDLRDIADKMDEKMLSSELANEIDGSW